MNTEEFEECWLIAGTVRVPPARKAQWERTVRPLPFDRVKQFLEGWAKSQAPSPEDVIQGIRSGKAREVRVDCAICGGYGTAPTLAVTPEGKRTEYGARCHCVAGRRYGALPTVDQLRPTGGQVFINPTLTQRRETGSVQSWLDFGKEAV